jgi:rubrerythrin
MMLGMVDFTPQIKEKQARMSFWEEVLKLNPDLPNESATLDQADLQIENHKQEEIVHRKEMAEIVARQIAWQAAEQVRQERQVKVRAELERIAAMSNQEAWDRVGNCPKCGFSHRWDGVHCSHCGHPHRLPD